MYISMMACRWQHIDGLPRRSACTPHVSGELKLTLRLVSGVGSSVHAPVRIIINFCMRSSEVSIAATDQTPVEKAKLAPRVRDGRNACAAELRMVERVRLLFRSAPASSFFGANPIAPGGQQESHFTFSSLWHRWPTSPLTEGVGILWGVGQCCGVRSVQ